MDNKEMENLWIELGDIPFDEIDNDLYLANDWLGFQKGTHREEIWHWFDENHSKGVAWLMFEFKCKNS